MSLPLVNRCSTTDEEKVLDEAIETFKTNHDLRNQELIEFLNSFVTSEEYKDYMQKKKNIKKRHAFSQYEITDTQVPPEDKHPLTTKTRKMFLFKKQFDKYITNKNNKDVVKTQEKGIAIIREKIAQYKKLYVCTKDKITAMREEQRSNILRDFCENFNIDLSNLSLKSRDKIKEKVVCYKKVKNCINLKVKSNIMDIVRKLTEEYKRKREIEKALNKTYTYKVKKHEKILKDMEIVGQKIILKPRFETKVEEVVEEEPVIIEEPEIKEMKTNRKHKNGEKDSKKSRRKSKTEKTGKPKKGSDKKDKKKKNKEKTAKKGKKEDYGLIVPPIPICNVREKLGPQKYDDLLELLTTFEKLEKMLENQYRLLQETYRTGDNSKYFVCTPKSIIFTNFNSGKTYKKYLKIINVDMHTQKLRLLKKLFEDPYDVVRFKIDPFLGIQKLSTGCSVRFTISFSPKDIYKLINGRLVFVAYCQNCSRKRTFFIQVQCVPPYSDLQIHPPQIDFGKIPIWRGQGSNYKIIQLKNTGTKSCIVIIKKAPDPLDALIEKDEEQDKRKEVTSMSDILEYSLDHVLSNFEFEDYYIKMEGRKEINLKVKLKNIDHVGHYFEKYYVDVYDTWETNVDDSPKILEISAAAEFTDSYIKLSPEVLDFGICILNSVYQLSCDVYNNSSSMQAVTVKFPSTLAEFIRTDAFNLYIPSLSKRRVWLKFSPRIFLLHNKTYYNKTTSILEFPVYYFVSNKTFPDIPPLKVTIFAVLTTQKCLAINPCQMEHCDYSLESVTLNLGECSILETVTTDIELTNNTMAPQIYGFMNLPPCLTITPGFGEIMPEESKILKLHFNPDIVDVIENVANEGSKLNDLVVRFKINLETVSFIGQCKKEFNHKQFRRSVNLMFNELKTQENLDLMQDMLLCVYSIKNNLFSPHSGEDAEVEYETSEHYYKEDINAKEPCKTQLWLSAKIIMPLVEFSHQNIEFPSTPCGSYSTMQTELRTITVYNSFKMLKPRYNFTAYFKIFGGDKELKVEPTCGSLQKGEIKKITFIANPDTPKQIVLDTAKALKYSEVYECMRKEYQLGKLHKKEVMSKRAKDKTKKEDNKKRKDKKGKNDKANEPKKPTGKNSKSGTKSKKEDKKSEKGKKGGSVSDMELENKKSEIIVPESQLTLNYLDYYPAEMYYWRSMEPYLIEREFVCVVTYKIENMKRGPEILYLNAKCKVIKPNFITNLKSQRITFGDVVIGMKKSMPIVLQNIHHDFIEPQFSLLSPVGPFSLPCLKDVRIPPEHFLEVPIIFEPTEQRQINEYFEMTSGATKLSLILEGTGVAPQIEILPNYTVFRLQTNANNIARCPIEIKNLNNSEITITIKKLFEAKGIFKELKNEKTEKPKDEKIGKKENKREKDSKKSKDSKKIKKSETLPPFSNELTETEQVSMSKYFSKKYSKFCYDTINIVENKVHVDPLCTKVVHIGFGLPDILAVKKVEELKKLTSKKTEGKKDKNGKSGKKSDKSKGSQLTKLSDDQEYHVTKYNILLNKTFLKDIILISTVV